MSLQKLAGEPTEKANLRTVRIRLRLLMEYSINIDVFDRRIDKSSGPSLSLRNLVLGSTAPPTQSIATVLLIIICTLLSGCNARPSAAPLARPTIEFTNVPMAAGGDATYTSRISGRVFGAQSGQRIVLYSKSGTTWWVQPFVDDPFTKIRPNSRWSNSTHPGTEYAALLVGRDFQPLLTTEVLPTAGVVTFAVIHGEPAFWHRWWFPFAGVIVGVLTIFGFHRMQLHQTTRKLSLRFDERLGERMRVAQELHDTFLQGMLSASMQLHVAVEQIPEDSPAQPKLNHVLELMGRVVDEGRNTLRGLSSSGSARELEQAFSRIPDELNVRGQIGFRIIVAGPALPVRSAIRNDLYSIGREALVNAFRHSQASEIEMELEYAANQLRVLVRDNGCGIDPEVLHSVRSRNRGLSQMRERARKIGARLKVATSGAGGTEVELSIPSNLVFESYRRNRASDWFINLFARSREAFQAEPENRRAE
jgi:signal transduction histidine kinase